MRTRTLAYLGNGLRTAGDTEAAGDELISQHLMVLKGTRDA